MIFLRSSRRREPISGISSISRPGVVLSRENIAPLFERLETIDKVKDLATVSRLLQGRGACSGSDEGRLRAARNA